MLNTVKSLFFSQTFLTIVFFFVFIQSSDAEWYEQNSGVTTALYSVSAYDNNVVWLCGANGRVLRTTNGGAGWTTTTSPNATLNLYNICAVNDSTALVTGTNTTTTFVYKTTNRGVNWSIVFQQANGFIDAIVQIQGSNYGMVGDPVGGRWQVWVSTDEGSTWDSTSAEPLWQIGNEAGWNNALCIFGDKGWIGTNNTRIYYTPYQGQSWIIQPTPGLTNSYAIWFNNDNIGMTGGAILMKTTNSGTNWNTISAPGTGNILGITGENNEWWYVRGNSIYYSSNNGQNWSSTPYVAPSGNYQHISRARNGNINWAVRDNGGITKGSGPTAIQPIGGLIPDNFKLYQNYPNPFNPSTSIKFDLSKATFARLVIYDELGREVAELVKEQLKPGTYEIEWDAAKFVSGAHFCRLTTDRFSDTRKMILVK